MTFSETKMMELGRKRATNTHNKRSLILTSQVCHRCRAVRRNQQVKEYKHTHTNTHAYTHTQSATSLKRDSNTGVFLEAAVLSWIALQWLPREDAFF